MSILSVPGTLAPSFTGGSAVSGDFTVNPQFGDVSPAFAPFRGNSSQGTNALSPLLIIGAGIGIILLARRL